MARSYLNLLITGLTSFLFFYLGQAHLTADYTPDLARKIEGWSQGCSEAWWWFALDAESVSPFARASLAFLHARSVWMLTASYANISESTP